MTEDDLRTIEARANAATPGPWFGQSTGVYGDGFHLVGRAPDTAATDLEFIAAARADVPALVAEVRRLRAAGPFQQALQHLQATYEDLFDPSVSDDEAAARAQMIELCRRIARAADANEPRQRLHTFID